MMNNILPDNLSSIEAEYLLRKVLIRNGIKLDLDCFVNAHTKTFFLEAMVNSKLPLEHEILNNNNLTLCQQGIEVLVYDSYLQPLLYDCIHLSDNSIEYEDPLNFVTPITLALTLLKRYAILKKDSNKKYFFEFQNEPFNDNTKLAVYCLIKKIIISLPVIDTTFIIEVF